MDDISLLTHNGSLVLKATKILQDAVDHGTAIMLVQPDGTQVRLHKGFTFVHYELAGVDLNWRDNRG